MSRESVNANNEELVSHETRLGIYISEEADMVSASGKAGVFGKQVASATGMLIDSK